MAESKKTTPRKPPRTIEQQIQDLQAKAEAKTQRQREVAWKKYEAAVASMKAAKDRYVNALHAVDEQRQALEDLGVQVEAEEDTTSDEPPADVVES